MPNKPNFFKFMIAKVFMDCDICKVYNVFLFDQSTNWIGSRLCVNNI